MGKTIAMINLKGGVAKTTTTVGLAEVLSKSYNKKVLVIDLDPQTNATIMLIGEVKWKELNDKKLTIATLFKEALDDKTINKFNITKSIQKNVSNVKEVTKVDLLPSSLDLIEFQDMLCNVPNGKFSSNSSTDILSKEISKVIDLYDYILIDCPPNLGIITLNGLRIADKYIIPTIPDVLSTYGIPQITKRVKEFSKEISKEIEPLGILITKFRVESNLHIRTKEELLNSKDAKIFETVFPENSKTAEAAEFIGYNTLKQKWGYGTQYDNFNNLAKEIIDRF